MEIHLSKTLTRYFNIAKEISYNSDHPQHKLGCVVVKGHRIISSGNNSRTKCNGIQAKLDKDAFGLECKGKLHAETDALLPLIRQRIDLNGAYLFIYREHKNGEIAMARPCDRCMKVIKSCGIKKIYYTTENGYCKEVIL